MSDVIHLCRDEYLALVKGDFTLRPCAECHEGTIYVDGSLGILLTPKNYHDEMESDHEHLYTEECIACHGLGKIVQFSEDN